MPTTIPDTALSFTQAFDTLPRAAFAGFEFPVSKVRVSCSLRDHVHEYPHTPGGAPEKLGRKLYEFHFESPFFQGMQRYPKLWPETLASLRIIFEGGQSFDLVVPTIGTITAYCTSWEETADPKAGRNGVTASFSFREDQSDLFLVTNLIAQTTAGFQTNNEAYQQALADQQERLADAYAAGVDDPDILLLTGISSSALSTLNQVVTVANQVLDALTAAAGFGFALASLAEDLVSACQTADALDLWADPTRFPLLDALHALWLSAQQLATDALSLGIKVVEYTVPQPGLPVGTISTAIYGDASHALEILQTNAIFNPFLVPGGTVIKAYLYAPQTQGAT